VTTLSATTPPNIVQDCAVQRQDLAADLKALTESGAAYPDAPAALNRPAVLRRLAAALAQRVPAGTDRLVALSGRDTALATAISLHTGIPFALVDLPACAVIGELHPSERSVIVGYDQDADEDRALDILTVAGVRPTLLLFVVASDRDGADKSLTRHALFSFAELSSTSKESHHV
jgi:hypothetical protein